MLAFRAARDWAQFHRPKELAAALAIEAGELQEQFLWRDPEPASAIAGDAPRLEAVRDEVADVAIYLLLLAYELKIDVARAIVDKVDANEARYPVDQHRGVARKATSRRGPTP